jgi:L-threonylcarbamoyladenylate synthase
MGVKEPMKMAEATLILKIDPTADDAAAFAPAAAALRADGLMAFPTETFYGLGGLAFSARAVERIYALKRRDRGKPLSVVVADLAMAEAVAGPLSAPFLALARAFWPGPLTLIARARPLFPPAMLGPGGSLAMRVPGANWLRGFLRMLGAPVTATSANPSGGPDISRPEEIIGLFRGKVEIIVDGGPTPGGLPSTIVDLTAAPPRLLRAGAVPEEALRPFLGPASAALT